MGRGAGTYKGVAEGQYMSTKRKVDKNKSKQVRIDAGIHKLLKIHCAERGETLRSVIEGCLADVLGADIDKTKRKNVKP